MTDSFGDWRHWAVTTVAQDVPAAYPGGPSHPAGSAVYLSTMTHDSFGRLTGFTVASPVALALSVSVRSAVAADELRRKLRFEKHVTPLGPARGIPIGGSTHLYDYFEECM